MMIVGDVILKNYAYTYTGVPPEPASSLRHGVNIIKRQWINYSVPQLVRMGMLPLSAYEEYEKNKVEAEPEPETANSTSDEFMKNLEAEEAAIEAPEEKPRRGAFWEQDDGERELMSADDFAKFLAENGIGL